MQTLENRKSLNHAGGGIEKVLQGWEQVEGHSHERELFWC